MMIRYNAMLHSFLQAALLYDVHAMRGSFDGF